MPKGQGGPPGNRPRSSAVAERAEATRAALIRAARTLFVEKGYHATGTEEIVALAGVGTRGALYHHFADKRELFRDVFEAVEQDLLSQAAGTGEAPIGPLEQLRLGLLGFLDASLTPEVQRILLLDGPAVLGWQEWRALEERYGLGAIQHLLDQAVAVGEGSSLVADQLEVVAHILLAAVDEAALFIANASDPVAARESAVATMERLINGLVLDSGTS